MTEAILDFGLNECFCFEFWVSSP